MPGTLFLVATPIGNLEDITFRAVRVLREVRVVAAEDTRRTLGLMAHFGIHTPLTSLHEHNERGKATALIDRLRAGDDVALVTDAGTPLVSDPGAIVVRAAIEAGLPVRVVPGPSAVLAAVVASGIAGNGFSFLGFVPSRDGERRRWLLTAGAEPRPAVFFEAPHRIRATLESLLETLGDRDVAVARELTKVHEEVLRGPASRVLATMGEPRGEYTVVMAPPAESAPPADLTDASAWADFQALTAGDGAPSRRDAIAILARRYGVPSREVYAAVERGRRV